MVRLKHIYSLTASFWQSALFGATWPAAAVVWLYKVGYAMVATTAVRMTVIVVAPFSVFWNTRYQFDFNNLR